MWEPADGRTKIGPHSHEIPRQVGKMHLGGQRKSSYVLGWPRGSSAVHRKSSCRSRPEKVTQESPGAVLDKYQIINVGQLYFHLFYVALEKSGDPREVPEMELELSRAGGASPALARVL